MAVSTNTKIVYVDDAETDFSTAGKRLCTAPLSAFLDEPVSYTIETINTSSTDGFYELVLTGSDGSVSTVRVNDSTELPDIDTTYNLQVVNGEVSLVGSDGTTSGGTVTIQTYDETLVSNPDGSFTFVDDDGNNITIPAPRTPEQLCDAVYNALSANPAKIDQWKTLIDTDTDTDTVVTYTFGSLVDDDPNDGFKTIVLTGSDGTTTSVTINDSTELPDDNTTYTFTSVGGTVSLVGSDGTTQTVVIQTYDENFVANPDGSISLVNDDGTEVLIPRPRTPEEICDAVYNSLLANPTKAQAFRDLILQDLVSRVESLEIMVDELTSVDTTKP